MIISPRGKPVLHVRIEASVIGWPYEAVVGPLFDIGKVVLVTGQLLAQPAPQGEWQGCWLGLFERANAPA
ncbi:hypothetical protein U1701_17600 [Sphingomonas sp. PB2P19]